jgi:uncharacterized membrane protein YccC
MRFAFENAVLPAFPIPAPPGTPPWINILFGLAAIATVAVLVWQAVRFFRDDRNDRGDDDRRDSN